MFGGVWMQDQYLSPLLYRGYRVGIGNSWLQPFRLTEKKEGSRWEHIGKVDGQFMWMYNPVKTNIVYAVGVRGGWGAYYAWAFPKQGVRLWVGPYMELDFLAKWHVVNVNKPFSMDAAVDMMAMAGVSYAFRGRKTSYRLSYHISANMMGVDYVPDYWQSYYEVTEGVIGRVRFSGMWNHRVLSHGLDFDMQLPHSTWRIGVEHEYVEYGIKGMMFSREQVSLVVGTVFRYRLRPNHNFTVF
jgi:hypothetical protein